ncbi:MAG: 30S ribosomal protein S6 [Clostridia bacterium]|jgi:ribosomal protein S6|nr:30S ribosomal protein S6 [Clostridia bacterium]
MNNYETIFLMKDDITEEQKNTVIEEIRDYLTKNGKISVEENLGKKKLAYKVREYEYAYYYLIQFVGKADIISELERKYRINENILKFITIKR